MLSGSGARSLRSGYTRSPSPEIMLLLGFQRRVFPASCRSWCPRHRQACSRPPQPPPPRSLPSITCPSPCVSAFSFLSLIKDTSHGIIVPQYRLILRSLTELYLHCKDFFFQTRSKSHMPGIRTRTYLLRGTPFRTRVVEVDTERRACIRLSLAGCWSGLPVGKDGEGQVKGSFYLCLLN